MRNEKLTAMLNAGGADGLNTLPTRVIRENSHGAYADPLETVAFENGEIHLLGEIDEYRAQQLFMLFQIGAREKKDIKLFINSPGGSVRAGFLMLDAIRAYPCGLSICCTGLAASMAAVLLAGGRKGRRYILPHSNVMIHEPLIPGGMGGSATSIQRTAESIIETKKVLNGLLAEFTGRTAEEIDKNTSFDNFFNAEEAIEFGLCDKIITGYESLESL